MSAPSRRARTNAASPRGFYIFSAAFICDVVDVSKSCWKTVARTCTVFVAKKFNPVVYGTTKTSFPFLGTFLTNLFRANGSKLFRTTVRSTSTYEFTTNNVSIESRQKQSAIIFVRQTRLPFFSQTPTSPVDTIPGQCVPAASIPAVRKISTVKNAVNYFLPFAMSEF